jgi:hypothetical protein
MSAAVTSNVVFPSAVGRVFIIDPEARTLGMQFPVWIDADDSGAGVAIRAVERPPP